LSQRQDERRAPTLPTTDDSQGVLALQKRFTTLSLAPTLP
jgi:hypothetical protein